MSRNNLKTNDLLELASLDALGLLDEEERRAFESAFRAAPASLQSQIRREQRRLTSVEDLLPEVEPPASLRARVIAAVLAAFGASADREADVIASIAPRAWSLRGNVTPLWRAACIGFATATIVLLALGYNLQREYQRTLVAFRDGEVASEITKSFGPQFVSVMFDPETQNVHFAPAGQRVDPDAAGQAMILINPKSKVCLLMCRGLEGMQGEYRLVVVDDAGAAKATLARFTTKGEIMSRKIDDVSLEPGTKLAILAPLANGAPGAPVLQSRL